MNPSMRSKCAALFGAAMLLLALCAAEAAAGQKGRGQRQAAGEQADPLVRGAKVLAAGVFVSSVVRRERSDAVADGIRDEARDFRLVRRGTAVAGVLGEGVGLRYRIEGEPQGAKVLVNVVVRHPAMVNPDTQLPMTVSSAQFERTIGAVEHALWNFDTPGSLMPGAYTLEVLHKGKVLARQSFQVRAKK